MLTDKELQSLRNLGNEAEAAAAEIARLRWDLGELRGRIAQMERDEGKAVAAERERCAKLCDLHARLTWNDDRKAQSRVLAAEIRRGPNVGAKLPHAEQPAPERAEAGRVGST